MSYSNYYFYDFIVTFRLSGDYLLINFYLTALKGCRGIVLTHGDPVGQAGVGEKGCPGCVSETVSCRMLILGRDIAWGCRCATSWCDLDLIFDLAVVTLTYNVLSWPYLSNRKVQEFDTW